MKPIDCQWLDDYLAGELPCDWVPLFEQHVEDCAACGEQVAQWRALRADLSRASRALETPPDALTRSILENLQPTAMPSREPPRARRFVAAAAVCVVAGLFFTAISGRHDVPKQVDDERAETVVAQQPVTRVELPDDVIGVPIDIGDPDVTVVWVYPVYRPTEDDD